MPKMMQRRLYIIYQSFLFIYLSSYLSKKKYIYIYLSIYLSIYLRPTAVESGQRAMELAIAPEFTLCPTADLTMAMLKKVVVLIVFNLIILIKDKGCPMYYYCLTVLRLRKSKKIVSYNR